MAYHQSYNYTSLLVQSHITNRTITYHQSYNYTPQPTMHGNNLNNNLMTMLSKVQSRGYLRIWTFDSDDFDTRNEFKFAHKAGTGSGNFALQEGRWL